MLKIHATTNLMKVSTQHIENVTLNSSNNPGFLNPFQGPGISGERISLDSKPLEDTHKELRKRRFFFCHFTSPPGITYDSGSR